MGSVSSAGDIGVRNPFMQSFYQPLTKDDGVSDIDEESSENSDIGSATPLDIELVRPSHILSPFEPSPRKIPAEETTFMSYLKSHKRGLLLHYWSVGFAQGFIRTPLRYYLVVVKNMEPDVLSVLATLIYLPSCIKVLYGVISDNIPIFCYRRRPYILIGWAIFSISFLVIYAIESMSDSLFFILIFFSSAGLTFSELCSDALTIEWSVVEPDAIRGRLQLYTYTVRFMANLLGLIVGTYITGVGEDEGSTSKLSMGQVYMVHALQPVVTCFVPIILMEEQMVPHFALRDLPDALRTKAHEIFDCVSYRPVVRPLFYFIIHNISLVPNAAWYSFLVVGLGFTMSQTGMLSVIALAVATLSLIIYGRYFEGLNWRFAFVFGILISFCFFMVNVILILRLNVALGIPDFLFSVGDDVLSEVFVAAFAVPTFRIFNTMCPLGSEGVAYAILTSAANLGYIVAAGIGTGFTHIWDVSNEAMAKGQFDGVLNLQVLCSCISLLPLCLVTLIPRNSTEQLKAMANGTYHRWCGLLVIFWIVGGILFTIIMAISVLTRNFYGPR